MSFFLKRVSRVFSDVFFFFWGWVLWDFSNLFFSIVFFFHEFLQGFRKSFLCVL